MHFHFPLLLILLSLSIPSLGETWGDLVKREGLYYKKFTDVPFTGDISFTGKHEGWTKASFKNGRLDGQYIWYFPKHYYFYS